MSASFSATRKNKQTYPILTENSTFANYFSQIIDKPVDFSLQNFCTKCKCKLCIDACEVFAISCEAVASYKIKSVSNNPGVKRWVVDVEKCYMFWIENGGGCSNCIAACPFSK